MGVPKMYGYKVPQGGAWVYLAHSLIAINLRHLQSTILVVCAIPELNLRGHMKESIKKFPVESISNVWQDQRNTLYYDTNESRKNKRISTFVILFFGNSFNMGHLALGLKYANDFHKKIWNFNSLSCKLMSC